MVWRRMVWGTAAVLVCVASFLGCGDEEKVLVTPEPAIKVAVNTVAPDTLDAGGVVTVHATVSGQATGPFTYSWTSEAGTFANSKVDSTTWTTPDNAGMYTLSVVVSNGKDVGVGTAKVAVGMYTPSVHPYYVGVSYCATCHTTGPGGDQYAEWTQTAHAAPYGTIQSGSCAACHTVGTNGILPDSSRTLDNGGYDETHVLRLTGIQCENCHGPGSEHPTPTFDSIHITKDASLCGQCHNGDHHPTYEEWSGSAHAVVVTEEGGGGPALSKSCVRCHNGHFSDTYLDDPVHFTAPTDTPTEAIPQTCVVCHDPHSKANPGQLRNAAVEDVVLPGNITVAGGGLGRLCMNCHNGRRDHASVYTNSNSQINIGNAHFGPHHAVQGDVLAGVNAVPEVNPTFAWASSKHINIENSCVTCHMHTDSTVLPQKMGHTWEPTVEACKPCHGAINSFDDIQAKQDFDGNGTIQGVQSEVTGLMHRLEQTIIDKSTKPGAAAALEANFESAIGDSNYTTREQRMAGYNWAYVDYDGSRGVHNANYEIQLLQQSILFLDPNGLPKQAYILRRAD